MLELIAKRVEEFKIIARGLGYRVQEAKDQPEFFWLYKDCEEKTPAWAIFVSLLTGPAEISAQGWANDETGGVWLQGKGLGCWRIKEDGIDSASRPIAVYLAETETYIQEHLQFVAAEADAIKRYERLLEQTGAKTVTVPYGAATINRLQTQITMSVTLNNIPEEKIAAVLAALKIMA